MKAKALYLTPAQLSVALVDSQEKGEPTVEVCEYFKRIAQHMLNSPKYVRYSLDLKDDMTSAALLKCIKNIKNFKREYADKCFNYYTRVVEHAFWEVLMKMYKQANIVREATKRYVDQLESISPTIAKSVQDALLDDSINA